MKSIIKKTKIAVAGLALAIGLSTGIAKAQVTGSVEGIKSLETGQTYVRPTLTYQLPLDIKGTSFVELYGEKGYAGKTNLTRQIYGPVSIMGQAAFGSSFDTRYGLGISVGGQIIDGVYAKTYIIPHFVDSDLKEQKHKGVLGYFASVDLPLDSKLSSFGEIRIDGGQGPEWAYGEISLEKKITDAISVSYQPALKFEKKGQLKPKYEHRVDLKVKF